MLNIQTKKTFSSQFSAVFWKNIVIGYRSKELLAEIIFPLITSALMMIKNILPSISFLAPIIVALAINGSTRSLLIRLVEEKSGRHKETQKIMGLSQTAYFLAWYTSALARTFMGAFLFLLFPMLFATSAEDVRVQINPFTDKYIHPNVADIRSYVGFWDVYFNYDATNFIVLYFFYVLSSINQSFMISSCFSNPKLAGEIGTFFTTITTLLSFLVYYQEFVKNSFWFYIISIFPQANMAFGYITSVKTPIYYTAGVNISPYFDQNDAIYEMIGTTVFYILLYFYLEMVIPNEYGIAKHPLLCLKKKKQEINSLRGSRISQGENQKNNNLNQNLLLHQNENDDIEQADIQLHPFEDTSSAYYHESYDRINELKRTVEISKLTKKFGVLKAVNEVSFSLYEKNIFCLLGHNGAGKTTMISVLTGLVSKSRGDVKMYGMDLEDELEVIRQNLGICSQRDVVYDEMTFIEHLEYYATIKGVQSKDRKAEIESILKKTKCMGEKDKLAMALSGGNRRKLSLGMALIGGSQIVFLDEPTSGMDAISRRAIWEVLEIVRKEERTIVLTTHHLDEAEVLADRIGIMAKGKLLAVGSSDFIKKNFGVGYHLRVFPNSNYERAKEFTITNEIKENVKNIIEQNIPGSAFNPQSRKDMLIFLIPYDQASKFGLVFDLIEQIDGLQINLEMNSLEDAFVNIGMEEDKFLEDKVKKEKKIAGEEIHEKAEEKYTKFDDFYKPECLSRPPVYRFSTQFLACFLRKYYCSIRAISNYLAFFIPLVLLIAGATILEVTDNNLKETEKLQVFSMFIALAYSFNGGIYIMLPVQEREENLKYALNVMGCRVNTYWLATFTFDMIAYLLTATIFMIVCVAADYSFITLLPAKLLLALAVFGFSFINFSYMCGFLFKKANSALKGFPALNFFVVFNLPYAFQGIFALLYQEEYISKGVWTLFGIFFNILNIFFSPFYNIQVCVQYLPEFDMADQPPFYYISYDYWVYVGILVFQGFFYALVTFLLEQKKYNKIGVKEEDEVKNKILSQESINEIEDEAVLLEKDRIQNLNQNIDMQGSTIGEATDKIIAEKLWKQYDNGFVAIKDVTYGVKKGEIFGLLGPNGSGKSTSFNILTSLIPKTLGSVKIKNIEVNKGIMKIYQDVGICPQFDCIWPNLNPIEHLYLFGRMKGLKGKDLKEAVEYFIKIMQLTEFVKTKAKNLSGGNKRKLCVSDALIGGPDIQFFDEPSTGVDPIARRFLWNTLQEGSKLRNSSIVLTTHTMEEAESLCTKIGILINGQFYCLGSPSELRHKYGEGYTIVIKSVSQANQENCQKEVLKIFPNCKEMKDKKENYFNYRISNQDFSFSKSYKLCQKLKDDNIIIDYSINQSSLEQVFVYFSKYQNANQK